ncbi:uncharacterized protein [Clytia hemisphaerica]|uniref:uncharacterized protein isoform X1 n=1 Tax=Clytia hemisphaerica TaxID=252671 RepID=UPI0034D685D3
MNHQGVIIVTNERVNENLMPLSQDGNMNPSNGGYLLNNLSFQSQLSNETLAHQPLSRMINPTQSMMPTLMDQSISNISGLVDVDLNPLAGPVVNNLTNLIHLPTDISSALSESYSVPSTADLVARHQPTSLNCSTISLSPSVPSTANPATSHQPTPSNCSTISLSSSVPSTANPVANHQPATLNRSTSSLSPSVPSTANQVASHQPTLSNCSTISLSPSVPSTANPVANHHTATLNRSTSSLSPSVPSTANPVASHQPATLNRSTSSLSPSVPSTANPVANHHTATLNRSTSSLSPSVPSTANPVASHQPATLNRSTSSLSYCTGAPLLSATTLPGGSSISRSQPIRASDIVFTINLNITYGVNKAQLKVRRSQSPEVLYLKVEQLFPNLIGKNYHLVNSLDNEYYIRRNIPLHLKTFVKDNDTVEVVSEDASIFNNQLDIPSDLTFLEKMRSDTLEKFTQRQELLIRRTNLVDDTMTQFNFSNSNIYVRFEGERGEDLDGLSRSLFSDFWNAFCEKYGIGYDNYLLTNPSHSLSPILMKNLGQILASGYMIANYIPPFINNAVLFQILTGNEPSNDLTKREFLKCLNREDCKILQRASEESEYDVSLKNSLQELFVKFSMNGIPSPHSIKELTNRLIFHVTFALPACLLYYMKEGIKETNSMPLNGITEDLFITLMQKMKPNGVEVADLLEPKYTLLKRHEEKVFEFVKEFVKQLPTDECCNFLRFVTGCERLAKIYIEFNGAIYRELMVPLPHTCGPTLEVSRYIENQEDLDGLFRGVLKEKDIWVRYENP